ncbi:hypothetical protein SCA6_015289, partial [Theobroma cacao]
MIITEPALMALLRWLGLGLDPRGCIAREAGWRAERLSSEKLRAGSDGAQMNFVDKDGRFIRSGSHDAGKLVRTL